MGDRVILNKQAPAPLQNRIAAVLANENAGSAELNELIGETEQAIAAADEVIVGERAKAIDITASPTAEAAQDARSRADAAAFNRDRLQSALRPLREKLTGALADEAHDRWLSDFSRVRQRRDDAVSLFRDYHQHAQAIVQMFAVAAEMDKEVSRINGSAPDGEHRRLRRVELEARDLDGFTTDNPSLASTVELRDWENAGRKLWPCAPSLAEQYAQSLVVPYHPGAAWSDPGVTAQRRAEAVREQNRLARFYAEQTETQELRVNEEALAAFRQQQQRRT